MDELKRLQADAKSNKSFFRAIWGNEQYGGPSKVPGGKKGVFEKYFHGHHGGANKHTKVFGNYKLVVFVDDDVNNFNSLGPSQTMPSQYSCVAIPRIMSQQGKQFPTFPF